MIPQNEMGVVALFCQKAKSAGVTILGIGAAYPDARIERNGKEYLVEFEYKSSNFAIHGHDIRKCDLVICWEDDYKDIALPVIELCKDDWMQTDFIALSPIEKEAFYWKQRALAAEKLLRESSPDSLSQQTSRGKVADTRQRISQVVMANSNLSSAEIGKLVGVSAGRVRQLRKAMNGQANGHGGSDGQ